jgi:hypothetical protein
VTIHARYRWIISCILGFHLFTILRKDRFLTRELRFLVRSAREGRNESNETINNNGNTKKARTLAVELVVPVMNSFSGSLSQGKSKNSDVFVTGGPIDTFGDFRAPYVQESVAGGAQ